MTTRRDHPALGARFSAALRYAADAHRTQARILLDYRAAGDGLWARSGPETDAPWYYGRLAEIFARRLPGPHADELGRVVGELRRLVAGPAAGGAGRTEP